MNITSAAFCHGSRIPDKHSLYHENISPPLHAEGMIPGAKSWALIMGDPDAPRGLFTHWLVYNIDPQLSDIAEGSAPANALEGRNDFGKTGYGGPRPPSGEHRYFFKVYALAEKLDLPAGVGRAELEAAMSNHVLDSASVFGRYPAPQSVRA